MGRTLTDRDFATIRLERLGSVSRLCWAIIIGPQIGEVTLEHRGTLSDMEAIARAYVASRPERILAVNVEYPQDA